MVLVCLWHLTDSVMQMIAHYEPIWWLVAEVWRFIVEKMRFYASNLLSLEYHKKHGSSYYLEANIQLHEYKSSINMFMLVTEDVMLGLLHLSIALVFYSQNGSWFGGFEHYP